MSYIESNLLAGEAIIATGKVHWFVYAPGGTLLVLGALAATASAALGAPLILIGIVALIHAGLKAKSTELAVTNKRVIAKWGILRRSTIELLHSKVEGLSVDQGILGRILNFGDIVVNGTGASKTPIPKIGQPLEFRKQALGAIEVSTTPLAQAA